MKNREKDANRFSGRKMGDKRGNSFENYACDTDFQIFQSFTKNLGHPNRLINHLSISDSKHLTEKLIFISLRNLETRTWCQSKVQRFITIGEKCAKCQQ